MAIELVRRLCAQKTVLPSESGFYERALRDIETDGISSQIYTLLQQKGLFAQTPFFFQKRLKESYTKGLYQNLLIKNQTALLLEKLAGEEIEVIPLKGIYFSEKFFGHFAARPTSDIDLLIKPKDIEKAAACVKSLGFAVEEEMIPGHFHCSYSKQLPHSEMPLVVELHWEIVKEHTANFHISDFWNEARPIGESEYIKELSNYHTFYLICLHGWRHNLDSLKYFLDIMQIIQQLPDELDYLKLLQDAAADMTRKRIVRTLTIVYQQFPHLNAIKAFPFERKRVYWQYHSVRSIKQYVDFIDYQFLSYDHVKHSLKEAFHFFFPNLSK